MKAERIKKTLKTVLPTVATILVLILAVCGINHNLQLKREAQLLNPMGMMVKVNGHTMHIYTEGEGAYTLLFLSGGGTCSPVLDFKSLYSLLSGDYRIAVVEKAGYGFSEDAAAVRDVDTVLEETRQALSQAGIRGPFVLCPHSMSGIEALYWAQQYPEEVSAIIGLDMAVPASYKDMGINIPLMKLGSLGARLGLTRWIPGLSEGDAIKGGTLTEKEREMYRALFYRNTLTGAMIREASEIKASAVLVGEGDKVDCPVLMFASNGSGGTGYDTDTWRGFQAAFAEEQPNAKVVALDCPHYVHDYKYREIAEKMGEFLSELQQETE